MILAIDQGTTGTTCLVFDGDGRIRDAPIASSASTFRARAGSSTTPNEIWDVTRRVASHALADAKADPGSLDAIGITNQRETVVAWDPDTGEPVHNALVWQDRRTASRCDELREAGHEDLVRERTGLVLDPYFSGTKIEWLLRNVDAAADAVFGTIDSLAGVQAHRAPRHRLLERVADDAVRHPRTALGPRALRPARRRPGEAARAAALGGRLRHHHRVRRRDPRRRDRRRPAGRPLRPGLPPPGDGEEHLWHRQLRAPQRGRGGARPGRGPADHDRLGNRRPGHLCPRGGGVRHRRGGPVASRRARDRHRGGRDRGHGGLAGVQRRRLLRTRADRPRLSPLGPVRARDHRRPHARHLARAPGPRRARGDRLRNGRRRPRPGAGRRRAALRAAGRRRGGCQPLADAVPGRRARGARDRPRDRRDNGPRRRLPGRHRRRALDGRRGRRDVEGGRALRAVRWIPASASVCSGAGPRRSTAPRGWASTEAGE